MIYIPIDLCPLSRLLRKASHFPQFRCCCLHSVWGRWKRRWCCVQLIIITDERRKNQCVTTGCRPTVQLKLTKAASSVAKSRPIEVRSRPLHMMKKMEGKAGRRIRSFSLTTAPMMRGVALIPVFLHHGYRFSFLFVDSITMCLMLQYGLERGTIHCCSRQFFLWLKNGFFDSS